MVRVRRVSPGDSAAPTRPCQPILVCLARRPPPILHADQEVASGQQARCPLLMLTPAGAPRAPECHLTRRKVSWRGTEGGGVRADAGAEGEGVEGDEEGGGSLAQRTFWLALQLPPFGRPPSPLTSRPSPPRVAPLPPSFARLPPETPR